MKYVYLLMIPTLLFAQPPRRPQTPPHMGPPPLRDCRPIGMEMAPPREPLTPKQREKLMKLQHQYRLNIQKILRNP